MFDYVMNVNLNASKFFMFMIYLCEVSILSYKNINETNMI